MEAIAYRAELLFMRVQEECMAFNVWKVNGNSDIFIILPHKSALSSFFFFFYFSTFFFQLFSFMKRVLKCNNGIPVFTPSTL